MRRFIKKIKLAGFIVPAAILLTAAFSLNVSADEPILDETSIGLEDALVFTTTADLTVNVNGEWSAELSGTYVFGDAAAVTAPASISGKSFSYWEAEGTVISYDKTITLTMNANTTLNAVYGKSVTKSSTAGFTSISKDTEGNMVFNAYSSAERAAARGIYYSKTASTKEELLKNGTKEEGSADSNCCSLTIVPDSADTYYYVMPYVTNNTSTFCGDVKKVRFSELELGTSDKLDLNTGTDIELDETGGNTPVVPVSTTLGTAETPTVDEDGIVHWEAVENAASYKIVKEYSGKTYFGRETTETSYQQKNVVDVKYNVYIRAFDKYGNYTDGDVLTVPAKLSTPEKPSVDDDGVVTWNPVKNAVKYIIVKEYNGKAYTGKETDKLSYKQNYVPIAEYKVFIRAYDEDGNFVDGEKLTVPEKSKRLGKVKEVNVDEDGVITWEPVTNAVEYKVAKVVNGKTYYGVKTKDTQYKFNYVPKSDYKVFVVAFDKYGNRTWGNKVSVTVK